MPESSPGRKAVALGYRQGYAKGMRQGLYKGVQAGAREGRRKGVIEGMRRVILKQAKRRFGPVPAALQARLERIADPRALERVAAALLEVGDSAQLGRLVSRGDAAPGREAKRFRPRQEGPASAVNPRRPRRMKPVRTLF